MGKIRKKISEDKQSQKTTTFNIFWLQTKQYSTTNTLNIAFTP